MIKLKRILDTHTESLAGIASGLIVITYVLMVTSQLTK